MMRSALYTRATAGGTSEQHVGRRIHLLCIRPLQPAGPPISAGKLGQHSGCRTRAEKAPAAPLQKRGFERCGGRMSRGAEEVKRCAAMAAAGYPLARKNMVAVTAWLRRFSTTAVSRNTWNVSRYPIHGSCSSPRVHRSGFRDSCSNCSDHALQG